MRIAPLTIKPKTKKTLKIVQNNLCDTESKWCQLELHFQELNYENIMSWFIGYYKNLAPFFRKK